jgi:hypothetical protein
MDLSLDPVTSRVERLFRDPDMFDSREHFRAAGFEVNRRSNLGKIMVGSHAAAEGFLFKKYSRDVSLRDQLENYECRVKGAGRLRALIEEHRLRHVVVPRKWILELPREFSSRGSRSHVLVVERLDLLDTEDSQRAYRHIDEEVLRELCLVVHEFRGLDSNVKNVPFTRQGQVAFVDTEHWDRHRRSARLRHLREHMSRRRARLAGEILDDLEEHAH